MNAGGPSARPDERSDRHVDAQTQQHIVIFAADQRIARRRANFGHIARNGGQTGADGIGNIDA